MAQHKKRGSTKQSPKKKTGTRRIAHSARHAEPEKNDDDKRQAKDEGEIQRDSPGDYPREPYRDEEEGLPENAEARSNEDNLDIDDDDAEPAPREPDYGDPSHP